MRTAETTQSLIVRLNKIQGQITGIKKMLEDGVACEDVLTQLNAINGGLHRLSYIMLEAHLRHCVREGIANGNEAEAIESMADALESYSKMA